MMQRRPRYALIGSAIFVTALAATATAQHTHGRAPASPSASPTPEGSRRITMEELHRMGGVPRGWKFALPAGGDATRGKQVFGDLECFKCHEVAGFPPPGGDGKAGPPLTSMGGHHPAEYFAESILSPNAVIVEGPGYIGPDGRSIMPSYADSLSVTQLVDLVAFIKSQDGGHDDHGHGAPAQQREAGPYRLRLAFHPSTGSHAHGSHGHHGGSGGAAAHGSAGHGTHAQHGSQGAHDPKAGGKAHGHAPGKTADAAGHLVVVVTDAVTGEAVPYVPVTAVVHAQGAPARTLKLAPMLGPSGFHYGADAALPAATQRIVVTVGTPTIRVMGEDRGRYARPQSVTFSWSAP